MSRYLIITRYFERVFFIPSFIKNVYIVPLKVALIIINEGKIKFNLFNLFNAFKID